jgi:pimeloyl-ACP methyl ester carboxylesterase
MDSLSTFTCRGHDGIVLSGARAGDPDGKPVVLLHGYSDSWRSFLPLMRELPLSLRLIAISLRGHGDSAKPEGPYGTGPMSRDVVAAMDQLGIARAVLVGHSMGSLVAQRLAQDYADRVSRLVLIGAFATLKDNPEVDTLWRDALAGLTDPVDPSFARAFQQSSLNRPVPADFLAGVIDESLKLPARVWRAALDAVRHEDRSALLGRIAVETTIIWGDHDGFCHRTEQDRLTRSIPAARLVVHEGTGHAPHWEEPARAAADIAAAIGTIRQAAA